MQQSLRRAERRKTKRVWCPGAWGGKDTKKGVGINFDKCTHMSSIIRTENLTIWVLNSCFAFIAYYTLKTPNLI